MLVPGKPDLRNCIPTRRDVVADQEVSQFRDELFEKAQQASSKAEIVGLINDFDLPLEAIPTQWLNELEVWDALLQRMPLTALVRNLGKTREGSAAWRGQSFSIRRSIAGRFEYRSRKPVSLCWNPPMSPARPAQAG